MRTSKKAWDLTASAAVRGSPTPGLSFGGAATAAVEAADSTSSWPGWASAPAAAAAAPAAPSFGIVVAAAAAADAVFSQGIVVGFGGVCRFNSSSFPASAEAADCDTRNRGEESSSWSGGALER